MRGSFFYSTFQTQRQFKVKSIRMIFKNNKMKALDMLQQAVATPRVLHEEITCYELCL